MKNFKFDLKKHWWIMILALISIFFILKGQGFMGALIDGCTSNEPTSLTGYLTMCGWTIDGESQTKCDQEKESIDIAWGNTASVGETNDAIIRLNCNGADIAQTYANTLAKEKTRLGIEIFSFTTPNQKIFYFCSANMVDYWTAIDYDNVVYYHPSFDATKQKWYFLKHPSYLNYPCPTNWVEIDGGCEFNINPQSSDAEPVLPGNTIPSITKKDYVAIIYADTAIEDKYFETFITCEPTQIASCWNSLTQSGGCVRASGFDCHPESFDTEEECIKSGIVYRGGTTCNIDSDCTPDPINAEKPWLITECQNFQCITTTKPCFSDADCRWIDEVCRQDNYPISHISRCITSGRFQDCGPGGCDNTHFSWSLLANPFNWFQSIIFIPALVVIGLVAYGIWKHKSIKRWLR